MSNIASSTFTASVQADGRSQVHEIHTDLIGVEHTVDYLAAAGTDLDAALAVHAANLGAELAAQEIRANVAQVMGAGAGAAFTFDYSAIADTVAAGVAAFADATPAQAIMLGDFLQAQTPANLEAWFGLTADQVAAIQALPTVASQVAAINALIVAVSL